MDVSAINYVRYIESDSLSRIFKWITHMGIHIYINNHYIKYHCYVIFKNEEE